MALQNNYEFSYKVISENKTPKSFRTTASSPMEALKIFNKEHPEVIFIAMWDNEKF